MGISRREKPMKVRANFLMVSTHYPRKEQSVISIILMKFLRVFCLGEGQISLRRDLTRNTARNAMKGRGNRGIRAAMKFIRTN